MLAASPAASTTNTTTPRTGESDPFVQYARSLHDYTLRLWTESRRIAEEKARRLKAAAGGAYAGGQARQSIGQKMPENASLRSSKA